MTMMEKAKAVIDRKFEGTDAAAFTMGRSGDRITVTMYAGTFSPIAESGSCVGRPEGRHGMSRDSLAEYLLEYEGEKAGLDILACSLREYDPGDMQAAADVLQTAIRYGLEPADCAAAYGIPEHEVHGMLALAKTWLEYACLHTKLFGVKPGIAEFFPN